LRPVRSPLSKIQKIAALIAGKKGGCMKRMIKMMIFVVVSVFGFGAVYAQFSKPEEAIQYRKSVMLLIGHHFKGMGAVVKGKVDFDNDSFSVNSNVVKMLSTLPWAAFMEPGTDKGDTTVSSAVFKNKEKFMEAAQSFETATAKLAEAAKMGDLKPIKQQFAAVARNCKTCHQQFRSK
jgi:cytochrome c556